MRSYRPRSGSSDRKHFQSRQIQQVLAPNAYTRADFKRRLGCIEPKTGNRAQNTANCLGELLDFLRFLLYCWVLLGVLSIPKLLSLTSGHNAIFVGTFLELPEM